MEKRIESIERDIKDINSKLGEYGQINAVIASQMKGIHITLGTLADNQSQLIALQVTLDNMVSNCKSKGTACAGNFDEAFTRLRYVEHHKISDIELDKCKKDVLCQATKALKPLGKRTDNLERNQRWGVLAILGSIMAYAVSYLFGGNGAS